MTEKTKPYDLENRTTRFAQRVRVLARKLPRTLANIEDVRQLIRSSGSVAANFIEANEALSRKDFLLRIKICRKESRESRLWLQLLDVRGSNELEKTRIPLIQEARELTLIFSAIVRKGEADV